MINPFEITKLGKTAVEVPRFGLGTAHISVPGEEVAIKIVQNALEQGITFFDTAPLYGSGEAERYLGKALAAVPRDTYVLATKVGRRLDKKPIGFDYSRDSVLRNLEESLDRLQVDAVDILHIHDPDDHYQAALDEAFPALADLRSQGVIKAIGSGMNQWQMLQDFATHADFDCFLLAGRFTLLEQTSLDFLELCQQKNIAIILGGVYNSGVLASDLQPSAQYNYAAAPPEILAKARQLAQVCQRHGVPLNAAAAQFPYFHPAVTTIVMGADAPDQVAKNLAALQHDVPAQLWSDLQQEGLVSDRLNFSGM